MLNISQLEQKMKDPAFCWFANIFLIFIIYYTAELSRLLGNEGTPLAISIAWPATGFSLAALLLFGYRLWPGIFLGNFCYNLLYLYLNTHTLLGPLVTATIISLGSTFQALLGAFVMKRYSSPHYFQTIKDIIIFLLPAGFITCLIASSFSVPALYFFGSVSPEKFFHAWTVFWLGDTLGVYIITPLLVVWVTTRPQITIQKYAKEALLMLSAFVVLSIAIIVQGFFPLAYLFIPLSGWVTYRFRMHGAVLSIFLIAISIIVPTTLGLESFMGITNPLLVISSFLEITVAISLLLAAILDERESSLRLIPNYNISSEESLEIQMEALKKLMNEVLVKEKLISLSLLASGITKQFQISLKGISNFTKATKECLHRLQAALHPQMDRLEPEVSLTVQNDYKTIESYLRNIDIFDEQANEIAEAMQEAVELAIKEKSAIDLLNREVATTDINAVLDKVLEQSVVDERKKYPDFTFTIQKAFADNVKGVLPLPGDFEYACMNLFTHAVASMKEKREKLDASYIPSLMVTTKNLENSVEVVIRDNGIGMSTKGLKSLFQSLVSSMLPEVSAESEHSLALFLAHDIIVHIYRGTMKAESVDGEFFQLTLTLPKI